MKMKIVEKIRAVVRSIHRQEFLQREVYAKAIIDHLFPEEQFLPVTDFSISLSSLATICNDIVINDRKQIFEFGSGLSTLIISSLLKKNQIPGRIYSVEQDESWIQKLKETAKAIGTDHLITFIHAPLVPSELALEDLKWYNLDEDSIRTMLNENTIDLVLVDGPPAYSYDLRLSRYPALPFIVPFLSEKCSVYLDDTGRKGEKEVLAAWSEAFNMNFIQFNGITSVAFEGPFWKIFPR